ncbi:hypothetical protein N7527_003295 [Penicillium freii]|nr:hypothetical protein N7527_003295 [Penicillium freii]
MMVAVRMGNVNTDEVLPASNYPVGQFFSGLYSQLGIDQNSIPLAIYKGRARRDPSQVIRAGRTGASRAVSLTEEDLMLQGTSFSGGNVIYAAAIDKRIKTAVVQCPAVSGETRSLAFQDRIPELFADRARIAAGEPRDRVPCIAPDRENAKIGSAAALFPDLHAYDAFEGIDKCAQAIIHRIAPTPLLMVVLGNDVTVRTSSQLAAFRKAREPKELVFLDKAGHFDIYRGEYFERNIAAQIQFLKAHLV